MSYYNKSNVRNFKVVTGPIANPVTKKRAKDYLRVTTNTEDGLINSLVTAATLHVERITGRYLMSQTVDLFMDCFPVEINRSSNGWWDGVRDGPLSMVATPKRQIEIWKAPVQSIEFLKTFSVDDSENIFPATNYIVDKNSWPSRIVLRQGETWPTTNLRTANGIQIRFKAGYENADAVPEPIIQALLLIIANLYENRGDEEKAIAFPPASTMLLNNYMLRRL